MSPLGSAGCSPPPQKFLQLMGNPHPSRSAAAPGRDGACAPGVPGHSRGRGELSELSCCGDEQRRALLGPRAREVMLKEPQLSIIWCQVVHPREEEEEEKGLVLVLLGYHKQEVRPCLPQCHHSISHEGSALPRAQWPHFQSIGNG